MTRAGPMRLALQTRVIRVTVGSPCPPKEEDRPDKPYIENAQVTGDDHWVGPGHPLGKSLIVSECDQCQQIIDNDTYLDCIPPAARNVGGYLYNRIQKFTTLMFRTLEHCCLMLGFALINSGFDLRTMCVISLIAKTKNLTSSWVPLGPKQRFTVAASFSERDSQV